MGLADSLEVLPVVGRNQSGKWYGSWETLKIQAGTFLLPDLKGFGKAWIQD